jgi:hypothetical protein
MAKKSPKKKAAKKKAAKKAAPKAPNFEYTFVLQGVEVSHLDINGTMPDPILANAKVYADTGKPFLIQVIAELLNPGGSGTLQLKYLTKSKNVFDEPQQFTFDATGRGGLSLDNVQLP